MLDRRHILEKLFHLFRGCETHHPLYTGPVVPAAVEKCHLARRRKMSDVPLDIHLRLFPLRWRGKGYYSEDSWAGALGDRLDHSTLPCRVATLEHHDDLGTGCLHPLLKLDQFNLQLQHLLLEFLAAHLWPDEFPNVLGTVMRTVTGWNLVNRVERMLRLHSCAVVLLLLVF